MNGHSAKAESPLRVTQQGLLTETQLDSAPTRGHLGPVECVLREVVDAISVGDVASGAARRGRPEGGHRPAADVRRRGTRFQYESL